MNATEIAQIEQECNKLSILYANCLDTFEHDKVLELFAADGVWNHMTKGPLRGHDEIRSFLAGRNRELLLRHIASNGEVNVVSATRATGRSYWTAFIATPSKAGGLPTVGAPASIGAYDDEYVCIDGRWLFATRTMHPVFVGA